MESLKAFSKAAAAGFLENSIQNWILTLFFLFYDCVVVVVVVVVAVVVVVVVIVVVSVGVSFDVTTTSPFGKS